MFGRTTFPERSPDVNGVWRCSSCGEMASPAIPAFRWAGDCWQHSHPEAQMSFECRYFGPHPEPQYKPITFEETAGVPPQGAMCLTKDVYPAGGQRSGREAHNLTVEGSTPSPATTLPPDWPANVARPLMPELQEKAPSFFARSSVQPKPVHGWERACEITPDGAAPLRRHIALSRDFDLAVYNILDYAETRLLDGEDVQLDRVAELIAAKVRENLQIVYRPLPQAGS